jgi:hypothetical protein
MEAQGDGHYERRKLLLGLIWVIERVLTDGQILDYAEKSTK